MRCSRCKGRKYLNINQSLKSCGVCEGTGLKNPNIKKARDLHESGKTVIDISKILGESPFLVAQWVKK